MNDIEIFINFNFSFDFVIQVRLIHTMSFIHSRHPENVNKLL